MTGRPDTRRIGDMLDELLARRDGLTDWEVDFIESVDRQRSASLLWSPTVQQAAKVEGIWDDRIGGCG